VMELHLTKSRGDLDISVLAATCNRAEVPCQTLESVTHLDLDGPSV